MKTHASKFSSEIVFLLLFSLVLMAACKMNPAENLVGKEIPEKEIIKQETLIEISGYPLPTAFYITEMLIEAKAPYILSISNSPKKVVQYFSQKDKALNLGVYGADLSYAATYLMTQETMLFLEAAKQLRDELNVHTTFHENCYERVEDNLENGDSLILIISDSFYDTYKYLVESRKDKLAILVMTGSWIEGLYLTTQIALTAGSNQELLKIILEQESSLEKLLEILEPLNEEEEIMKVYSQLISLQKIYNMVQEDLNDDGFGQIADLIYSLRSNIVD